MHNIEPHYLWRNLYTAESDERSPFYGREYSEFEFTHAIYDHYIHPQWDSIGSPTLFLKNLYSNYNDGYCILELIGEWNDLINNDIMFLKRDYIDELIGEGINKFILVGENVLNYHSSDDCYYEEWFEDIEDGWIAALNFRDHVLEELKDMSIDSYLVLGGDLEEVKWRTLLPDQLFRLISEKVMKRIEA